MRLRRETCRETGTRTGFLGSRRTITKTDPNESCPLTRSEAWGVRILIGSNHGPAITEIPQT